ncbi:MAG: bifunctional UDP-N-acetylglucosamine diphosphorylase/glucosamine-1-phosphate N-acetyltransferase GlmU [Alcanivorax sp.]|jgi:bifunctional UDP-N-acetylglucosamine pyrophosphorylase/glucosamine-1-phosphate N-acetyltransferase|uniref:Bifunctional protein GlmU n=3 Tax=Alloalcanivorax TaxID=3020832 RepID=A0ABS0AFE2_9GAMM|nr:bifunctional UDP-N-acetylglucosamine diphosphorylase/glucosamine-1-phosphate N-acetyltransferase GlmU [Alloalcanivorax venustensis]MAD69223.1 bifunctional N-acetylglucosamine-1-phosphate uridyltransferase/glucosamine-1-phosphate acetyltransferase [Alcanivorax sp.]MEA3259836.1 bifunctional UDP-N-acetylglucosamine diphosphorylase/glucosamine-1-phosphate N-acetyltransferase GlmU [Pseudomonadota bacterium]SMO47232.1 UDP-N-acetylglucosamine pyrophosphorylase /glucosamine-1-phosphate N-acetyltransf|tara:strand:+ start:130091 stop:131449 length:1359 start_codon:yes stop_codon:yes gene_type:complete
MNLAVVILAAGKGTRMKSDLPKVLHPIAGRPMVQHVVDAAGALDPDNTVLIYGHGGDAVRQAVTGSRLQWAEQAEQLGTGHAVAQALPHLEEDVVLVLYGDVPLIQPQTLRDFVARVDDQSLALMTLTLDDPSGYGRVIRDGDGKVRRVVEQKDASDDEKAVREINTGILACTRRFLNDSLPRLSNSNAQGEYYLTDLIAMAVDAGMEVVTEQPGHAWEVDGVNDRVQLARLERVYQRVRAESLMRAGVTLLDPARLDIRGNLQCGQDVTLDINTVLVGDVVIGDRVTVGPNCLIRNARIGSGTHIEANSVVDGAVVGEECQVGPFARLRPGTELAARAKVGNFVETKKAYVGEGSKVNHLTYIGDSRIGKGVNVGAGTITCNYDGVNKFQTVMKDGAFIGSNSSLVAPVTIGENATVGAGSVVTKDVPDQGLAVARGQQRNIQNWSRPEKK